jgi:hypothetical protein
MYFVTWRKDEIPGLIDRARAAGIAAAETKLRELETHGPRWSLGSGELDICGYGAIHMSDGRTSPARTLRLVYQAGEADRWAIQPDTVRGGLVLDIWHMGAGRQELAVNIAAVTAAAQVLRDAGLDCTVVTWVD